MITPYMHTMPNGLRIVCVEMPHLHSAELAVYLNVGGRNDPHGKEGLSHFLEHILFRGSRDFPSSLAIEHAFEEIGGAPNASTDADSTCFYSRLHPDNIRRGMEILASMLMHPLFAGIEIEKRIIAEEAREDLNEAGVEINADTVVSRLLWPRHPLGKPTVGTLATIETIDQSDLQRHQQRYYSPTNAVVTVAGPVRHEEVFAAAQKIFGEWQQQELPPLKLVTDQRGAPTIRLIRDSDSQITLQLAFLAFSRHDQRMTPLRLLRRILAGGGSSRLYLKLREELGIIYSVEAAVGTYRETGCIAIDLSTSPDTLLQAVAVTLEELSTVCRELVPEAELQRVKRSYCYDLDYSRDSAYEMGVRYGWGELMDVTRSIEDDYREICASTAQQLRETARTVFAPDSLKLVAVGPLKNGMKKRLTELVDGYRSSLSLLS